ncbi:purine permease [Peptoniphilus sp. MSJ-1]|uniref:Purine permease n=1 Tax=Peptoniphilus ovalis TaxID=2841503 RepID=A0ABS6FHL9_9FIRM|nr:purine permease [Peptoniphilus ovalis]
MEKYNGIKLEYNINDNPNFLKSSLLGFQNILTAFSGIIAVPLSIAAISGTNVEETALMVSAALLASGICSFIQTKGIGFGKYKIGIGLPTIMGTDFGFVPPANAVINTMGGGLAGYFGATIMGAFLEFILSFFIKPLLKFFPDIVTSTVITLIGITMMPVAFDWVGGGATAENFGDPLYIAIATFTFLLIIFINHYGRGFITTASVFIAMIVAYIICIPLNLVDFSKIIEAPWIALPQILPFGITFDIKFLMPFIAGYLVTIIETVGVMKTLGSVCEVELSDSDIANGVRADAVGSMISPLFGSGAAQSFSQNVGLIPLTKCASRKVALFSSAILILMSFCPKFAMLVSIMPTPILGGAGILMFGTIIAAGIQSLSRTRFTTKNIMIIASSIGVGIGITIRPDIVSGLPTIISSLFSSGISGGTIVAVLLNILLIDKKY